MRRPSALPILLATLTLLCLSACAARVTARIGASHDAELAVAASIPPLLAAKLRAFPGTSKDKPLFDLVAVRSGMQARPGLRIVNLSNPGPDSLAFSLAIDDLAKLLASPEIAGPGLIRLVESKGESELILRFERGKGGAIQALAPGLDPEILDALSPPAMVGGDFTRAEYREMLSGILSAKAVAELDSAAIDVSIALPGTLLSVVGGTAKGSNWTFSLPVLDLLVLEKPLEFRARWKP
jgi:hypothetical protein